MRLEKIADVKNGQILTRICDKDLKDGTRIKVITPKSINNGFIYHKDLGENILKEGMDCSKLMYTEKGDIVIKLSTPYDSAIIREKDEGLVVPSFCALIRCNEKINRNYVLAILNNKKTIEKLINEISGLGMRIIKIGSIKNIDIPDIETQKLETIGNLYIESLIEIELVRNFLENQKNLIEGFIEQELKEE